MHANAPTQPHRDHRTERIGCIFGMPCKENFPASAGYDDSRPRNLTLGHNGQLTTLPHIFGTYRRMPAMRYIKFIVEPSKQRGRFSHFGNLMKKNAEKFFLQRIFGNTVIMIQPSLRRPTNIHGRRNMCPSPVEYKRDFVPIRNRLKSHLFDGSSGNNHSIVTSIAYFRKLFIKSPHVLDRRIFRNMTGDFQKIDFEL